jgi:hypothetical protein
LPCARVPWREHARGGHSERVSGTLGDDIEQTLTALIETAETLPGKFRPEWRLTYWAGVAEQAESWHCEFEGDILGDNGTETFVVLGHTAAEALRRASEESWRRVPRSSPPS